MAYYGGLNGILAGRTKSTDHPSSISAGIATKTLPELQHVFNYDTVLLDPCPFALFKEAKFESYRVLEPKPLWEPKQTNRDWLGPSRPIEGCYWPFWGLVVGSSHLERG